MKRVSTALLLVSCVTASVAGSAHAQRVSKISGRALGNMCTSGKSTNLCDAYLAGVMDSEVWSKKYDSYDNDPGAPVAFCVPAEETTQTIRGKVVSWLHAHNDALSQQSGKALYRALHDSYPCHAAEGQK